MESLLYVKKGDCMAYAIKTDSQNEAAENRNERADMKSKREGTWGDFYRQEIVSYRFLNNDSGSLEQKGWNKWGT